MICPCGGEKSSNWHYRNHVPVCDEAVAYRRAREKKLRATKAKPKPVESAELPCVCGGEQNVDWHRYRKLKPCRIAREARNARDLANGGNRRFRGKRVTWTPGTDIVIPEHDPL